MTEETADIGEIIGGYRLESCLARGGMGTVYAARHVVLGRAAAVKMISARYANDQEVLSRFLREAKVVNNVRHPNIVDIFDFIELENPRRVACVMEYLEGPTLKTALQAGPFRTKQAVHVALQLASALDTVHRLGIIHRDLKPGNVIVLGSLETDLDEIPSVKLLDFGIAKVLDLQDTSITRTGAMLGTPAYMAPEQISGDKIGPAADIYALGEIVFEMVAGRSLFAGTSVGVLKKKLTGEMDLSIGDRAGEIEAWPKLKALVERCLRLEPEQRCSLAHLRGELRALLDKKPGVSTEYEILSEDIPKELKALPAAAQHRPPSSPIPAPSASPPPGQVVTGIDANGQLMFAPAAESRPAHPVASALSMDSRPIEIDVPLGHSPGAVRPTPTPSPSKVRIIGSGSTAPPRTISALPRERSAIQKPRSRIQAWVLLFALAGIGVAVFSDRLLDSVQSEPIRAIARRVLPKDAFEAAHARNVVRADNPLSQRIAEWRASLGETDRSVHDLLEDAERLYAEDRWDSYAQAERALEHALVLEPKHPEALSLYVENLAVWKGAALGDDERKVARAVAEYAAALAPLDPAPVRASSALALAMGDLDACGRLAQKALERTPHDARARLLLASTFTGGDFDRAIEEASHAIPLVRRELVIARAHANAKRYSVAVRVLNDRLKRDKTDGRAVKMLADFEREQRRPDRALARYKEAAALPGDKNAALTAMGEIALELGHHAQAEEAFRAAAEDGSAPSAYRVRAWVGLGRAAFARGRIKEAGAAIESALLIDPHDVSARLMRAEVLFASGDKEQASSSVNDALATQPGEPGLLVLKARIALAEERKEDAIAAAEEALRSNPRSAEVRCVLVGIELEVGAYERALEVIREAAKLDPMERSQESRRAFFGPSPSAVQEAVRRLERATKVVDLRSDAAAALGLLALQAGDRARAQSMVGLSLKANAHNKLALAVKSRLSH